MPHLRKTVSLRLAGALAGALVGLKPQEIENVARLALRRCDPGRGGALEIFVTAATDVVRSTPNEIAVNGETWLLEQTSRFAFATIFDVGANIGKWAMTARRWHKDAEIHCFEIVPSTFALLSEKATELGPRTVLNPFGLSDRDGEIDVFVTDNAFISSIYDFDFSEKRTVTCAVRRGAAYAAEKGIDRIDLVKIDVEGAEGDVLRGLESLFDERKIRMAQFEYNRGAIQSRFLLADFYDFLGKRGYRLGKLTPDAVLFRDYQYAHEDFAGPNYVACLETEHELIAALSPGGIRRAA